MAEIREEAFSIPTYVLQHTMNGQDWPDGDEIFHQWLVCPVLLIYGEKDKLVSLDEEKATAQVLCKCVCVCTLAHAFKRKRSVLQETERLVRRWDFKIP